MNSSRVGPRVEPVADGEVRVTGVLEAYDSRLAIEDSAMAKEDSGGSRPKRGAFPTPRNILADAKPFKPAEPDKSGLAGSRPSGGANSQKDREQPNRGNKKQDL